MSDTEIKQTIEAILFAAGEPVADEKLAEVIGAEKKKINEIASLLINEYENNRGIEIIKLNNSYQMCTLSRFEPRVRMYLQSKKNTPLSNAGMEVLSIVAYNEPVSKSFIEQVRGVDSSSIVNNLVEKKLLEEAGRLNLPGRPISFKTTDNFLRCFNLSSLKDLPTLEDFNKKDGENEDSQMKIDELVLK